MPVKILDACSPELKSALLLGDQDIFSQLLWQLISQVKIMMMMIIADNK